MHKTALALPPAEPRIAAPTAKFPPAGNFAQCTCAA